MHVIVAKFEGEDGSMGFRNGVTYDLYISHMSVRDVAKGPWVPYGSLDAFFKNWTVIGRRSA